MQYLLFLIRVHNLYFIKKAEFSLISMIYSFKEQIIFCFVIPNMTVERIMFAVSEHPVVVVVKQTNKVLSPKFLSPLSKINLRTIFIYFQNGGHFSEILWLFLMPQEIYVLFLPCFFLLKYCYSNKHIVSVVC